MNFMWLVALNRNNHVKIQNQLSCGLWLYFKSVRCAFIHMLYLAADCRVEKRQKEVLHFSDHPSVFFFTPFQIVDDCCPGRKIQAKVSFLALGGLGGAKVSFLTLGGLGGCSTFTAALRRANRKLIVPN